MEINQFLFWKQMETDTNRGQYFQFHIQWLDYMMSVFVTLLQMLLILYEWHMYDIIYSSQASASNGWSIYSAMVVFAMCSPVSPFIFAFKW